MTTAGDHKPERRPGLGFGIILFAFGFALIGSMLSWSANNSFFSAGTFFGLLAGLALGGGLFLIIREARS